MSIQDRRLDIDVDLDENAAIATVTEEISIDEFFQDGELRLWETEDGWRGYRRDDTEDGGVVYHYVNTIEDRDRWTSMLRVGEQSVRNAIQERVESSEYGAPGEFVKGCRPR